MPTPTCSKCRRVIPGEEINVARDLAYCRNCNVSYRLSDLTFGGDPVANADLNRPPNGAYYRSDGGGLVVGATNRNWVVAAGTLFFALFWNGIVSIFVLLNIASTLRLLHLPPPDWFPAPKMENGNSMGTGMTLFLWLFLTPFILIGFTVAATCVNCVFGRTEVRIQSTRGTAFTGVGGIGWKRGFDASQIGDVRLFNRRNNDGQDSISILIETREGKQIKVGSLLTNERRLFLLGALKKNLCR